MSDSESELKLLEWAGSPAKSRNTSLISLIERIEDGKIVTESAGNYAVDFDRLDNIEPGLRALVAASVARSTCEPTKLLVRKKQRASANDIIAIIKQIAPHLLEMLDVVAHVEALIRGTSNGRVNWWGPTVELDEKAAKALAALVGPDLGLILTIVGIFVPEAAPVLAIVGVVGLALAAWIEAANDGNGVRLGVYFWVIPAVSRL